MPPLEVTVVVVTRDRRDEALRAVASAVAQNGEVEVLVIDDASRDGTADAIAAAFPDVRLERSEVARGCLAQRNRAARLARGRVLLSIDDDCEMPSPDIALWALADLDHPRVGIVAIPFEEPPHGAGYEHRAPEPEGVWVLREARGCAYAVGREDFLAVGGFPEVLGLYWEESDLALRLMDRGLVVRAGRGPAIVHRPSPTRHGALVDQRGRNLLLCAWWHVPTVHLPARAARIALTTLRIGLREGSGRAALRSLGRGLATIARRQTGRPRAPMSRARYAVVGALATDGHLPLAAVEPVL